jgi:peptide alpha-N-acetyltransferase
LKHFGDSANAAEVLNQGRLIDLQDRFINTKTVKYYLRANQINKALEIVSIFTKNDDNAKNGLKDLHTMQVNWFLIENAESYLRLYETAFKDQNAEDITKYGGLALKRFKAIVKVFEEYYNDQLDFHTFCMRRGTARAYIDMLKWEDHIFASGVYARAVDGASKILLFGEKFVESEKEDEVKDKKKEKKEKAARAKQLEAERAELIAYAPEEDSDVFGETLYKSESWVKLFQDEFFHHLVDQGENLILTHDLNFHLNFKLKKIPLAITALTKLKALTNSKYENLPAYLLTVKFKLGEEGLNKILAERLLAKNFGDFEFSDVDGVIEKYLDLNTVKGLLGLVKIVNLNLEDVKNDEYKQLILKKIEGFEPVAQFEILNALI